MADAQRVLQDVEANRALRQEATETLQSARDWFMKRCAAEVFSPQQNELIKKVYSAYNEVRTDVLKELAAKVSAGLAKRLDALLNLEQKAALEKGRAELTTAAGQTAPPSPLAK